MKTIKIKNFSEIPKGFTGIVEFLDGDKWWYKEDKFHREDGPAIEQADGHKEWWINGELHREDGPAVEYQSGVKEWYLEGKGYSEKDFNEKLKKSKKTIKPAAKKAAVVTNSDGTKYWYLDGKKYTEKDFNEKLKKSKKITKPAAKKTAVKKPVVKKAAVVTKLLKLGWEKPVPKNFTGIIERPDKTKYWYKEGNLHREDGPAVECSSGFKEWWVEGVYFSEEDFKKSKKITKTVAKKTTAVQVLKLDENASIPKNHTGIVEQPSGTKQWYKDGKHHREDGPAVEYYDGEKYWYKEGKLHRDDGPAVEYLNGTKYWYKNGEIHREDGPACEYPDGTKHWYKQGKWHREDGPALECSSGSKHWVVNGLRHREDGPASEFINGTKYWYKEGKLHREDGPAVECSNGDKEWFLNGKRYTEKDFNENLKAIKVKTASEIPDGFTGIAFFTDGSKGWLKDGKYHREDGPAIEYSDGTKHWYRDGYPHREDGPAAEYEDGRKEWWYKGLCYSQEEHSSLMKQVNKTPQTETSKQKVLQVVVSDSKEVALRVAVQKINLISKSILLKLFQKTKYTKMEDVLNSEIGKAMLKAITSALLEILKSKFDDKYKLVLEEISKEFRIQAETDLSIEVFAKIEEYLQSSPTMSFIQTRISVENFNNEQNENDNNQEAETTVLVSSYNGMLN